MRTIALILSGIILPLVYLATIVNQIAQKVECEVDGQKVECEVDGQKVECEVDGQKVECEGEVLRPAMVRKIYLDIR